MRRRAILWSAALVFASVSSAQDPAVTTWIRTNAVALKTVEARNGLAAPAPVAAWLNEPHQTRWIGSVYAPANAMQFVASIAPAKTFDAILFVATTTAARGLPFPR